MDVGPFSVPSTDLGAVADDPGPFRSNGGDRVGVPGSDERDLIAAFFDGEDVESEAAALEGAATAEGVDAPASASITRSEALATAPAMARTLWADLLAVRTAHVDSRKHEIAHAALAVAILWFCWLLVPLVTKDYRNFGTGHFDTGIFDQAAYLLAHGEQFMSGRGLNVFGHHANFGLYLFAPFYWIGWGSPALLDSAMVVSLGTAAVPVYLIARDRTASVSVGLVVAVAYLLHFSVSSTINEGFHPESMAVLPLFAAFLFADRGQWKRFAVAVVYAVCWKEDIALFVAMLGVYLFFAKDRRAGLITAAAGGAYFVAVTSVLLPAFAASGATFYAGDYGVLGDSGLEVAVNATLFERDETFRLLENNGARDYFFDLGQPYGWLSYLSPLWMLLALPQLAANLLNIHGLAANPFAHYVSVPVVALTLGLIATFANRKHALIRIGMAVWLVVFAFNTSTDRGYMPYSRNYETGVWQLYETDQTLRLRGAVELIPDDAAVVGTYNIVPRLTHRNEVYMWPNPYRREYWGIGDAPALPDPSAIEYLVLDRAAMDGASEAMAVDVAATWGFASIYEAGPVIVYQRTP